MHKKNAQDGALPEHHNSQSGAPPKGMLRTAFSRHAPWPLKAVRICAMMVAAYYATDLLPGEPLSEEETDLYQNYFQDAIDYERIKVHSSDTAGYLMGLRGAVALAFGSMIILGTQEDHTVSEIKEKDYYMM